MSLIYVFIKRKGTGKDGFAYTSFKSNVGDSNGFCNTDLMENHKEFVIPPAKCSFRGVYCFQPVRDSMIPSFCDHFL